MDDDELSNHKQQKVKGRKKRKIKRGKRKVVELKTPVAAAIILQRLYRRRFGFLKMVKMAQDRFKPFTYNYFQSLSSMLRKCVLTCLHVLLQHIFFKDMAKRTTLRVDRCITMTSLHKRPCGIAPSF